MNSRMSAQYWLVKSEPEVYSIDDLKRDGKTRWDGVRNFQARNNLRAMKKGDKVLVYHSQSDKAVVGVSEVTKEAYPDPKDDNFSAVDLKFVAKLKQPVALSAIKTNKELTGLQLITHSRLSVMPVSADHYQVLTKLAE